MMKLFASRNDNAIVAVNILLRELGISIHSSTVNNSLQSHPNYPSLFSISDSLDEWNISNTAYQINTQDYDPNEISFPILAHLEQDRGYLVVHGITDGKVTYSNSGNKRGVMPEEVFLEIWGGVLLHAQVNQSSGEKSNLAKQVGEKLDYLRLPAMVTLFVAGLTYAFFQNNLTFAFTLLSIITLAGWLVSVFLIIFSVDANNPTIKQLCSLGKENDCNAILKSNEAKITEWLSWTEVGLFYFSGFLLAILCIDNAIPVLAVLNLAALPYTFWSIKYQYNKKNWCVLCCAIQLILWLQFITFSIGFGFVIPVLNIKLMIGLFGAFSAPIIIWAFLKPFIFQSQQVPYLRRQLVYFGETDHVISWQTDHLICWRRIDANAIEALTKIVI